MNRPSMVMSRLRQRGLSAPARLLLALVLVLGSVSCTNGGASRSETTGTQAAALGTPFTVTISVPNPVSPLAPVLTGVNSIYFEGGCNVVSGSIVAMGSVGGGVHAEPNTLINETWSRGTAELRDRVQVRGTLHAVNRQLGTSVVIGSLDTTPVFDPPSTLGWTVTYPSATVGPSVVVNANNTQTLAPGQYGDITLNSRGTLNLSSGTYYLKSLDVEAQGTVNLNQAAGPVIIYENDKVILRGSFVPPAGSSPDLLIVELSSTAIDVVSLFNGAIVAPLAVISLEAVSGIHTGFFYGRDIQRVAAGTQVQYRAPLAILSVAQPSAQTCRQIVAASVPASQLEQSLSRYCNTSCSSTDDTDRDGVPDCADGCPYDPLKVQPGYCGCGLPETDSDGDGVPDCIDACPADPNNIAAGECGCVGLPGLAAAGTPCNDTACPQTGATCNGAGVCGNRSVCSPGTGCRMFEWHQTSYWFCGVFPASAADAAPPPGSLTEATAQLACSGKGETLTRVNSLTENRFIDRLLTNPLWLGANDLSASNVWRWSAPNTNNGDQFWSGGPTGLPVANRFANWGPSAPGGEAVPGQCAIMRPGDGLWFDTSCSESLPYVCEFRVPIVARDGGISPPGMPNLPPATACIPAVDAGLPDDAAVLEQQIALAAQDVFVGAAAAPPSRDAAPCPPDPTTNAIGIGADAGAGCSFAEQPDSGNCLDNSNTSTGCGRFGANFVCRQVPDDPNCQPGDASFPVDGETCRGHSACGIVTCPSDPLPCGSSINICNPTAVIVDAGVDPGSSLDAEPFNPLKLFDGGAPDAAPSPAYVDLPSAPDAGMNHSWCFMTPQNPNAVQPAIQPVKNKGGTSGGSSPISFGFDPDLTFDVHANPLALGENSLGVHAQAKLVASVALKNFLGQSYSADIVNVTAGITAKRCSISDDETQFTILGLDFIDPDDIPRFNTEDKTLNPTLAGFTDDCNDALANFQLWADRAKKAFRDAQQLLVQYHSLKSITNGLLTGDLCSQIGVLTADVPGFPGGNACPPNEPVEITINRFIDYFQAPGIGQVAQLRQAGNVLSQITSKLTKALQLGDSTLSLPKLNLTFVDIDEEESQSILDVPFAIGPVPMVLEVDAFARYGIAGNFDLGLEFPDVLNLTPQATPSELARVAVSVMPHASAGLSAFVGAGTDLGPFSATVGIEGAVTLADIAAPIFAGAGLDMQVTNDIRPIPFDLQPPVSTLVGSQFQFGLPTAFKLFLHYDYGAGVDLKNILNGQIDARLRIKFLFFSRTWRKNIVKFNGWSFHFDLVSAGGNATSVSLGQQTATQSPTPSTPADTSRATTNVASGQTTLGLSEPQVPLMTLAYLSPTTSEGAEAGAPVDGGKAFTFDAGNVESLFYDDLCCAKTGGACSTAGTPHCCPDSLCVVPTGTDAGMCQFQCKPQGARCSTANDCCPQKFVETICGDLNTCVACSDLKGPCHQDTDCCITNVEAGTRPTCDLVPGDPDENTCVNIIP